MGKMYYVQVHGVRGEKMVVDLCETEEQFKSVTVLQLKEKIYQMLPELPDVECLRLIFTDKQLYEDSRLLCEYGIQHMSVIHMVRRVPGGGPRPPDREHGGMGDKDGRNQSMEKLSDFHTVADL